MPDVRFTIEDNFGTADRGLCRAWRCHRPFRWKFPATPDGYARLLAWLRGFGAVHVVIISFAMIAIMMIVMTPMTDNLTRVIPGVEVIGLLSFIAQVNRRKARKLPPAR